MDQFTRRIVGFSVHNGDLDGAVACRMFNSIISKQEQPKRISSDNDPLFQFHRWKANLRILDIEEVKSVPYTPISHPFVERLIGTVRSECLDQTFPRVHLISRKRLVFFRTTTTKIGRPFTRLTKTHLKHLTFHILPRKALSWIVRTSKSSLKQQLFHRHKRCLVQ